ncbi:MAG: hypothetical protein Tsb002_00680 [Wenzhouxiangellaceae bacterium]
MGGDNHGQQGLASIAASGDFSAGHSGIAVDDALTALVTAVRREHGEAVAAVLFYGSCLRSGDPALGIADFYVLVSGYRAAGMGPVKALLNRLLPPNVYYLETQLQGHTLRAKYAVLSLAQFEHGASGGWLLPYLWGRFAQPSQINWTRTPAVLQRLNQALVAARRHFLTQASATLRGEFTTAGLWQHALQMSYRTELRAEQTSKIKALVAADPEYYTQATPPALQHLKWVEPRAAGNYRLSPPTAVRWRARFKWLLRRIIGKLMSVARLFKSLFTFSGAVDYAAWKIERHSGRPVVLREWERRYPWLGCWPVLWRLWRNGQLR